MTQQTTGHEQAGAATPPATEVARDEAARLGRTGADEARHVAGTAAEQAGQVTQEARRQAKDLFEQAREQATEQARNGQNKAADGLRALATELHQMADGGDQHGPASDLAKQAADRVEAAADWLARREPGDLVEEVRTFARRRTGTFLLGAALAGVLAGRLTRGAVDAARDDAARMAPPGPTAVPPVPAPRQAEPAATVPAPGVPAGQQAAPPPGGPGPGWTAGPPGGAPGYGGPTGSPGYPGAGGPAYPAPAEPTGGPGPGPAGPGAPGAEPRPTAPGGSGGVRSTGPRGTDPGDTR